LLLCTSGQLSTRTCIVVATQARKKKPRRISDEPLNESVGIRDSDTSPSQRRPSTTSTPRKQLNADTANAVELYAWSARENSVCLTPPSDHGNEELDQLRDLWKTFQQQQADKTRKRLDEGVISRLQAEWCCRCKSTTKFWEGECIGRYCRHERCHNCCNFSATV